MEKIAQRSLYNPPIKTQSRNSNAFFLYIRRVAVLLRRLGRFVGLLCARGPPGQVFLKAIFMVFMDEWFVIEKKEVWMCLQVDFRMMLLYL